MHGKHESDYSALISIKIEKLHSSRKYFLWKRVENPFLILDFLHERRKNKQHYKLDQGVTAVHIQAVKRQSGRRGCSDWHRGIIYFIILPFHFLTTKKVNAGHG